MQAITSRHAVAAEQLRVYLHYQPSYYHLHVHFLHVKHDAGMGMAVGKARLLSDVIGEGEHPSLSHRTQIALHP